MKLLFDNQYGFRAKYSTEFAALELIDNNNKGSFTARSLTNG